MQTWNSRLAGKLKIVCAHSKITQDYFPHRTEVFSVVSPGLKFLGFRMGVHTAPVL